MTDATQAVLTVGMPTLAVLVGILVNNSRLSDLRGYIETRFVEMDRRLTAMLDADRRLNEANFRILLSKIEDIDTRLTRLEERFAR